MAVAMQVGGGAPMASYGGMGSVSGGQFASGMAPYGANGGAAGYGGAAGAAGYGANARGGVACCGSGEQVTACGVGCGGGGGGGAMSYVGTGQGAYIQETTYKYVGAGGDFDVMRPRRDFTCIITSCCLLPLLLLLLWWLLSGLFTTSLPFDCTQGVANWKMLWSDEQQQYCCMTTGVGCSTTAFPATTPTAPPTPPPTPPMTPPRPLPPRPLPPRPVPRGDPFNCAVDSEDLWAADKRAWCCRVHHKGCPPTAPPAIVIPQPPPVMPVMPVAPARPADPYNCADGYANWQVGWSVGKKAWCCKVHGKGCPGQIGCATTSKPYDCVAGYANWMAGWSVGKKAWCCKNEGKGCPPAAGGCARRTI